MTTPSEESPAEPASAEWTLDDRRMVTIGKFLSKHLRHQPQRLGLTLGAGGWVRVDDLLAACALHGMHLTPAQLREVVARNGKQRFAFDAAGTSIRASQGHSVEVDLELDPAAPPATLYHGTGHLTEAAIVAGGLLRMARHHVHLSIDVETAHKVGARHGRPVIFAVDARAMERDGHVFYVSDNGVWLVDHVPSHYLRTLSAGEG